MAHPDATRQGNEKGQREHAGRDSEATDAGVQSHAQNPRGPGPTLSGGAGDAQPRGTDGAAGTQGQGDETPAKQGQVVEGAERAPNLAQTAGGVETGAGGEATVPPGESRILENRPAVADRGLEASSPGPAEGAPGTSSPR